MMTIILILLLIIFLGFSIRFTWWILPRKGLLSLMYHHIDSEADPKEQNNVFHISPQVFTKQIDMLLCNGFTPISFDDLQNAYEGKISMPKKPVLITFDDGYLNNYTNAYAILKEKKVKGNIFLTYNDIGHKPNFMTWQQVLEMQESGLVYFGSHTLTHRRLRSLSTEDALKELVESKALLEEKLSKPVMSFAYPYGAGAFDKRIRPLVFKAGYLFDFSTKKGYNPCPWHKKHTFKRAFPAGGETKLDFYLQITRGKSKL